MIKKITLIILILSLTAIAFAVEEDDSKYMKEMIDDFESDEVYSAYISIYKSEQAVCLRRNGNPAPTKDSTHYLGLKVFGKCGSVIDIIPPKAYEIDDFVSKLSIWVYGKNLKGELRCILYDYNGDAHIVSFGSTDFQGWKELTVDIPKDWPQIDYNLSKVKPIHIDRFQFIPKQKTFGNRWYYVYLDDFTKYSKPKDTIDDQSDDW